MLDEWQGDDQGGGRVDAYSAPGESRSGIGRARRLSRVLLGTMLRRGDPNHSDNLSAGRRNRPRPAPASRRGDPATAMSRSSRQRGVPAARRERAPRWPTSGGSRRDRRSRGARRSGLGRFPAARLRGRLGRALDPLRDRAVDGHAGLRALARLARADRFCWSWTGQPRPILLVLDRSCHSRQ